MKLDKLHVGNCVDVLRRFKVGPVDLLFADPPYNIGYPYAGYDDNLTRGQYREFTREWVAEVKRVLTPTASLFVLAGDEVAADVKCVLDDAGLHFRNWIIWHYTFGVYCSKKFGRCHAHVFYYTMHPSDFVFFADAVRVPSARQELGDRRANPAGKIPGDVWAFSRVCGTYRERAKDGPPCQTPEALVERCVRVASRTGQLVMDPFAGTGTTWAVCRKLKRRFVGIELNAGYAAAARKRVQQAGSARKAKTL